MLLLRFPFDTKSPFGYLFGIFLQYNLVMYAFCIVACSVSVGISSYFLVILAIRDMKNLLRAINKQTRIKSDHSKMSTQFIEFIEMHSIMKQFSKLDCSVSYSSWWQSFNFYTVVFRKNNFFFQISLWIFTNSSANFSRSRRLEPGINKCWFTRDSNENC